MQRQQLPFVIALCLLAALGFVWGQRTREAPVAAAAVKEGCTGVVNVTSVERVEIGATSETYLVKWAPVSPCFTNYEVEVAVTRQDGKKDSDKKKFNASDRTGLLKVFGKRDNNPTKNVLAVVNASGVLAAKAVKTINLTAPPGGFTASGSANAPTPVPAFRITGRVRTRQDGAPVPGATISFDVIGRPDRRTPPVETDAQGNWRQEGFPQGVQVKVTAFKRFEVMEPESHTVTGDSELRFFTRPADAVQPPPPLPTFSAGGRVVVNDLSQGTQRPLQGVTVSFSVVSANAGVIGTPVTPASVTSGKDGKWSQAGFTVGFTYKATFAKAGVTFGPNGANFGGNQAGQFVDDVGAIGTTGTPSGSPTFSLSGKATVSSLSQGTTTPLAGATISFALFNAKTGAAAVPVPVTTNSDGNWSQSGFTTAVKYVATITKPGVSFGDASFTISGPSQGINFLGKVK